MEELNVGQVWTPNAIADLMVSKISKYINGPVRILDPAAGPHTFYHAIKRNKQEYEYFASCDIDARFSETAQKLPGYDFKITNFLQLPLEESFNIVIMNPPYIRHELVTKEEKKDIISFSQKNNLPKLDGRANYYCNFILNSIYHLEDNGILIAIVYDSLDSTRYGQNINEILLSNGVFLERLKLQVPFEKRLIDAEILVWRKCAREFELQMIEFEATEKNGFIKVSQSAHIKRGTSFLKREFFIYEKEFDTNLVPILTKHKNLESLLAATNAFAYLASNSKENNAIILGELYQKYSDSKLKSLKNLPVITTAPILFNYYFRRTTKHLYNPKLVPVSDNFYCITPKNPAHNYVHWFISNSDIFESELTKKSRNQGNGLRKLQIFEYKQVLIPDYNKFNPKLFSRLNDTAIELLKDNASQGEIRTSANNFLNEWSSSLD